MDPDCRKWGVIGADVVRYPGYQSLKKIIFFLGSGAQGSCVVSSLF